MDTNSWLTCTRRWTACPWYQRAAKLAASLSLLYPNQFDDSALHETRSREDYREQLFSTYRSWVPESAAQSHTSSPFVFLCRDGETNSYIGGCDAMVEWARGVLSPRWSASEASMIPDGFAGNTDHGYDYDVVVIGGGSGGLACSKECARLGAKKVAVLDFVKPSLAGSTWGLGGTCVNVGCIPKKLMHTASILGERVRDDAQAFGWSTVARGLHDWDALRSSVQDLIKSMNFKYRVALREAGITYLNRLGRFLDAHTLELRDKKGETSQISSARFVVAVGGRPSRLACEGAEFAIDSDDIFSLGRAPGRTLCIGGGYVALECAGFLAGLGYSATCMVRSVVLRGFDRECVDRIEAHMTQHGVTMQVGVTPVKIEKVGDVLLVTDSSGKTNEYDTVLAAIGRQADTEGLGLDKVPGALDALNPKTKKLACVHEQLSGAPHLYALGDVLDGRPELTPVAIEAGLRLARRLYGGVNDPMDYENVATTVFTPLEYGSIGMTEEEAKANLGEENINVYVSEFTPLEYTLSEHRAERGDEAFAKLIVDKGSNERVVGFHYLGPNAGEVTQGFAVAMRKGATYADFVSTVGIHPTVAEEFTTMTVTKASGKSTKAGYVPFLLRFVGHSICAAGDAEAKVAPVVYVANFVSRRFVADFVSNSASARSAGCSLRRDRWCALDPGP